MWPPSAARTTFCQYENSSQTRFSMSRSTVLIAAFFDLLLFGLLDPRTPLWVTFSCGGRLQTKFMLYRFQQISMTWKIESIDDMEDRRSNQSHAINTVDRDMLRRVWDEFLYLFDVVRAAGDGHIEHL